MILIMAENYDAPRADLMICNFQISMCYFRLCSHTRYLVVPAFHFFSSIQAPTQSVTGHGRSSSNQGCDLANLTYADINFHYYQRTQKINRKLLFSPPYKSALTIQSITLKGSSTSTCEVNLIRTTAGGISNQDGNFRTSGSVV